MATRTIPFTIDKSDGTGILTSGVVTATVQYGSNSESAITVTQRGSGWSVDVDDTQDALVIVTPPTGAAVFGFTVAAIPTATIADGVWDETVLLTSGNHNAADSAGRLLRTARDEVASTSYGNFHLQASLDIIYGVLSNGTLVDSIWGNASRTLSDKSGFSLTEAEYTAIADEVERQIINDTDSEKVLEALQTKISGLDVTVGELTIAAIAIANRVEMDANSDKLDVAVSTRAVPSDLLGLASESSASSNRDAIISSVTGSRDTIIGAIPSPVIPEDWVYITPLTLGTDSVPIGVVPPNAKMIIYLGTEPRYEAYADSDGEFSIPLPPDSTWVIKASAPKYKLCVAEVTT